MLSVSLDRAKSYIQALRLLLLSHITGWKWNPPDRPSFAETHQAFETMFHDSSISEGESPCCFISAGHPSSAVSCGWAFKAHLLAVEIVMKLHPFLNFLTISE